MGLGTIPPQAYTRETLAKAYEWLQSQPESIRKIAQTPDSLVGLYLRSKRHGDSSLEKDAPVSSQNFKADLKNLAEGLKQFEDPKPDAHKAIFPPDENTEWDDSLAFPVVPEAKPVSASESKVKSRTVDAKHEAGATLVAKMARNPREKVPPPPGIQRMEEGKAAMLISTDLKLRQWIDEVKELLNLSDDEEVIKMLIKLGYQKVKELFREQ